MCKNCGKESERYFYDKVWRKMVCESCKNLAIKSGIRFEADYEEMKEWEKEGVNYWENPDCPREYLENAMLDLVEFVEGTTLRKDFFKPYSDTDLRKAIEHYEHLSDK